MRPRTLINPLLLVLTVVLVGCAPRSGVGETTPEEEAATKLLIKNNSNLVVDVYVLADGHRWRVATVIGLQEMTADMPPWLDTAGELQVQVVPFRGGNTFLSRPVFYTEGDDVELIVEQNFSISTVQPVRRT
jgi:hypothetical protein